MTEFTPIQSLAGGVLIGLAAVLLMALHGRIAGITGILAGLLPPVIRSDAGWRIAFLAGMLAAPLSYQFLWKAEPVLTVPVSHTALVVGGLIVGIGVSLGSGCTSGHGVCGLARFSSRSLVAVLTFMATAAITVFISRHVVGG
jgi:uncharacterized membrane protein YedE/YeeE